MSDTQFDLGNNFTPLAGAFFIEWEKLLSFCTHIPPENEIIRTLVFPTGFYSDRIGPVLEEFKEYWWTQKEKPQLVISGDISDPIHNAGSAQDIKWLYEYYGNITKSMDAHIITDTTATNTKENAEHTYSLLQERKITSPLVVITSVEHLPRLYSAFVKVILTQENKKITTKLFSLPIERHWQEPLAGDPKQKPRELYIPSEMERIHTYRQSGDIATEEELMVYDSFMRGEEHARTS